MTFCGNMLLQQASVHGGSFIYLLFVLRDGCAPLGGSEVNADVETAGEAGRLFSCCLSHTALCLSGCFMSCCWKYGSKDVKDM